MMNQLDCNQVQSLVFEYVDGSLPELLHRQAETHLQTCDHCTQLVQRLDDMFSDLDTVQGVDGLNTSPDAVFDAIVERLDSEPEVSGAPLLTNTRRHERAWLPVVLAFAAGGLLALGITMRRSAEPPQPQGDTERVAMVTHQDATTREGVAPSVAMHLPSEVDTYRSPSWQVDLPPRGASHQALSSAVNVVATQDAHWQFSAEDNLLTLDRGTLLIEFKPESDTDDLEVVAPGLGVVVTGTVLVVETDGSQSSAGVVMGSIDVTYGEGALIHLGAGTAISREETVVPLGDTPVERVATHIALDAHAEWMSSHAHARRGTRVAAVAPPPPPHLSPRHR